MQAVNKAAKAWPQEASRHFSDETPKQQALHREIALEHERKRRKRNIPKNNVRITELERVFRDRYGVNPPDDDAGRDDLFVMANHLAHLDEPDRRIKTWAHQWAPWQGVDETTALIETVIAKHLKWTADKLGERIGLNDATRARLGITTIGGTDCKKAERMKRRKKKDAARHKALRTKSGATPHALSMTQTEPWEAEGISRRTWYRRRDLGTVGTDSSAACPKGIVVGTNLCQPKPNRSSPDSRALRAALSSGWVKSLPPHAVVDDQARVLQELRQLAANILRQTFRTPMFN